MNKDSAADGMGRLPTPALSKQHDAGGRSESAHPLSGVASNRVGVGPERNAEYVEPTRRLRRRPWRWVGAAVVLYLLAAFVYSLWNSPTVNRKVIGKYVFDDRILHGIVVTLELTGICLVLGLFGGVILAVMKQSANPVLKLLATGYIQLFRALPPLVQLLFWGFLGALYPYLHLGLPFTGLSVWSAKTSNVLTPFLAAIVALTLIEAAYSAEIFRGGINGVEVGQAEAAHALGLTRFQTMVHIVLPQAVRIIIPVLGNQAILLLKSTSLVSVIGGSELLTQTQRLYSQNFQIIPLLMVAGAWYLLMISVLSLAQRFLERRFAPGASSGMSGKAQVEL